MIEKLMYISCGLILFGYIGYFLLILINRKIKITDSDGFNITKDILNEYDSINIIENTSYFTVYNIRRKVIKIASKCYYGNTLSDIAIPIMEAGISVACNNRNKFINIIKRIIPNMKLLYFLPIIMIFICYASYGSVDAKIGILLLVLTSIIFYMLINIKHDAVLWISNKIKGINDINKENSLKIINFVNKIILMDKLIFLGELVMIIRFVAILLEFN